MMKLTILLAIILCIDKFFRAWVWNSSNWHTNPRAAKMQSLVQIMQCWKNESQHQYVFNRIQHSSLSYYTNYKTEEEEKLCNSQASTNSSKNLCQTKYQEKRRGLFSLSQDLYNQDPWETTELSIGIRTCARLKEQYPQSKQRKYTYR